MKAQAVPRRFSVLPAVSALVIFAGFVPAGAFSAGSNESGKADEALLSALPSLPEPIAALAAKPRHSANNAKETDEIGKPDAKHQRTLKGTTASPTGFLGDVRKRAEAGDTEAQYLLGYFYLVGEGVPVDRGEAQIWLRKAGDAGEPRAQNALGLLSDPLWFGERNEAHAREAATWYGRAAQQGFLSASYNLQTMKDRKLVLNDTPPVSLERASLATTDVTQRGGFNGEHDLEDTRDARAIFSEAAPSVAEVIGDGNYGSGVAVARLRGQGGTYTLETASSAGAVPYEFFSRARKELVHLDGEMIAVLTNRHVLQGNNRVRVGLGSKENGETVKAFPVSGVCLANDTEFDVALILVPVNAETSGILAGIKAIPLYAEAHPPPKGSVVFALGNPEKLPRTITQGLFNGERKEGLQFDAPISNGSSGGALLDSQGRLLGLTVGFAAAAGSQNLNFAIPYEPLAVFLSGRNMRCYVP